METGTIIDIVIIIVVILITIAFAVSIGVYKGEINTNKDVNDKQEKNITSNADGIKTNKAAIEAMEKKYATKDEIDSLRSNYIFDTNGKVVIFSAMKPNAPGSDDDYEKANPNLGAVVSTKHEYTCTVYGYVSGDHAVLSTTAFNYLPVHDNMGDLKGSVVSHLYTIECNAGKFMCDYETPEEKNIKVDVPIGGYYKLSVEMNSLGVSMKSYYLNNIDNGDIKNTVKVLTLTPCVYMCRDKDNVYQKSYYLSSGNLSIPYSFSVDNNYVISLTDVKMKHFVEYVEPKEEEK